MPQLFSLYTDLTAEENVGFVAARTGSDHRARAAHFGDVNAF